MAIDVQTIIQEINDYVIGKCGGGKYNAYYVGITKNIDNRLFGDHKVPNIHCWIYRQAADDTDARAVEKYFLDKGMQGGGGGGDIDSVYVYVYKIASFTNESFEN